MSRIRSLTLAAASVATMSLLLASCTPATSEGGENSASAAPADDSLTIALDREIPSLDVATGAVTAQPALIVGNALYEPLMAPAPGGEVVPDLAESLTADDGDPSSWTLVLPAGLTFSDGSPFTAESVQAHIERLANPETGSSAAGQAAQITAMNVVDETTLQFELAAPNADFDAQFTRALGMVVSTEAVDEFGFPLGAGPYVVDNFTAGDSITVVRNENYSGDPAAIGEITFEMIPDADSRFQSVQSGDADLMWVEETAQIEQARGDSSLAVYAAPAAASSILLNLDREQFADVEVRRALAQAIDREAINAVVNQGEGSIIDSPYSLLGDFAPTVDYPAYDPDAAREVLEGENLSFSMTVTNRPSSIQRATALQSMLTEVGVTVEIEPVEAAAFGEVLMTGEFDSVEFVTSIFGDPSGGALLVASTAPYNFLGYANDEVDAALAEANATTDTAERAAAFETVSQQLATDLPVLWLSASNVGVIASTEVGGIPDLTGMSLISIQPAEITWAGQ